MGFLKDLRNVKKQADAMTPPEYKGLGGSMRMAKDGMAQMSGAMNDIAGYQQKVMHLSQVGIPGTATITAVRQTGTFVNENPECDIDLQVIVGGGAPVRGHGPPDAGHGDDPALPAGQGSAGEG